MDTETEMDPDADWLAEYVKKAKDSFDIFEKQVYEHGELDQKTKELIAVACSTVLRSENGVVQHTGAAKDLGATEDEIAAALGVAWLTTGSTQIYWMKDAYEELLDTAWYKRQLPEASKAFGEFHEAIFDHSELDRMVAELVGVGVSIVSRCQHCTEAHAKQAMGHGASKQDVAEAIAVAWAVGAESQVGWTDVYDTVLSGEEEDEH